MTGGFTPKHPIVVLAGDDLYTREASLKALRKAWVPEGMASLAHHKFRNPSIATVLDALQQVALGLVPQQMIEVSDFAPLSKAVPEGDKHWLTQLQDTLAELAPTKRVVFVGDKLNKTVTFGKWLAKQANVQVELCESLPFWKADDAALQLVNTAKAQSIALEPAAAHLLVDTYGVALAPLMNEVQKLALYAMTNGSPRAITVADVQALSAHNDNLFQMVDAWLAEQQPAHRFTILEEALLGESANRILSLMQNRVEQAFAMKYFQRHRLGQDEIAQRLKIKPGKVFVEQKKLGNISYDRLKTLRQQLLQAEWDVKRGNLKADHAVEALLAQ